MYRKSVEEVWAEVTAHVRANSLNATRRTLSESEVCVLQYIEEKLARRISAAERQIARLSKSTKSTRGEEEGAAERERNIMERELDAVLMLYSRAVGPSLWPEREFVPLSERERELIFGCVSDERVKSIVAYLLGMSAEAPAAFPEPAEIGPDIVKRVRRVHEPRANARLRAVHALSSVRSVHGGSREVPDVPDARLVARSARLELG